MTSTGNFGCAGTSCENTNFYVTSKYIEILRIGDFVNMKVLWFETLTYFSLLLYIWQNSRARF